MSKVATKNITFWNTTGYNYPGFGKSTEVPDGLGGTVGITYNQMDYNDGTWKAKPDGNVPVTEDRFLSGEIENNFSLIGEVKTITATMPLIRTLGSENNYSVTLDFSKYKASAGGSKASDGATSGDTYLAISRLFNGSNAADTTIKVTAITLDGSELNLGDWKLFNSGTLGQGNNARIFLDAATQIISSKNSLGKQEFCPTLPYPGSSFGPGTGLGLFELPSNQHYVSITLNFKQKKVAGIEASDLHDIYVASNTSSTSPLDEASRPPKDDSTSTTDGTNPTPTPDGTDTTQKPMEYKIYQVKGNPTIKTGYPASEWTAILAGFNCGAKQKHKATALTIMPVVDDGEWKIKCDIKDADDRYWDVAVLFIRNNMVNRLSNFYR